MASYSDLRSGLSTGLSDSQSYVGSPQMGTGGYYSTYTLDTQAPPMPQLKKFKIGDQVKVIELQDQGVSLIGQEGRIIRIEYDQYLVQFSSKLSPFLHSDGGLCYNFYESKLKLITKGSTMLNDIKQYFGKNKDIFFTLGAVLILDYFLFNGAMRKKVQEVVEKMLNHCEKKVDQNV